MSGHAWGPPLCGVQTCAMCGVEHDDDSVNPPEHEQCPRASGADYGDSCAVCCEQPCECGDPRDTEQGRAEYEQGAAEHALAVAVAELERLGETRRGILMLVEDALRCSTCDGTGEVDEGGGPDERIVPCPECRPEDYDADAREEETREQRDERDEYHSREHAPGKV